MYITYTTLNTFLRKDNWLSISFFIIWGTQGINLRDDLSLIRWISTRRWQDEKVVGARTARTETQGVYIRRQEFLLAKIKHISNIKQLQQLTKSPTGYYQNLHYAFSFYLQGCSSCSFWKKGQTAIDQIKAQANGDSNYMWTFRKYFFSFSSYTPGFQMDILLIYTCRARSVQLPQNMLWGWIKQMDLESMEQAQKKWQVLLQWRAVICNGASACRHMDDAMHS
jgi:hypothetical protein